MHLICNIECAILNVPVLFFCMRLCGARFGVAKEFSSERAKKVGVQTLLSKGMPCTRGAHSAHTGHVENWLAPGGGHGCRLKEGEGGVWEMDTCARTYVWSSLSAFFFF